MKRVVHCAALIIVLAMSGSGVWAQTPRRPYTGRDTWYEFMLKQFNPRNVDYGAWLEKRREAFLEATVREPHFWYSLSVTMALLLVLIAYSKLYLDHRCSMRITAEMMADIYTHDLYSRQVYCPEVCSKHRGARTEPPLPHREHWEYEPPEHPEFRPAED
jgi:hypothetical protein